MQRDEKTSWQDQLALLPIKRFIHDEYQRFLLALKMPDNTTAVVRKMNHLKMRLMEGT